MESPYLQIFTSVEGCIGVGKTTFLGALERTGVLQELLRQHIHGREPVVHIIYEPSEQWEQDGTLADFSRRLKGDHEEVRELGAFLFQVHAFTSRIDHINQILGPKREYDLVILERSMLGDRYIFWENQQVSEVTRAIYNNIWSKWKQFVPDVDHVLYLKTSLEEIQRRILKRSRRAEGVIPTAYLEKLIASHEKYFSSEPLVDSTSLDVTQDYTQDPKAIRAMAVCVLDNFHLDK